MYMYMCVCIYIDIYNSWEMSLDREVNWEKLYFKYKSLLIKISINSLKHRADDMQPSYWSRVWEQTTSDHWCYILIYHYISLYISLYIYCIINHYNKTLSRHVWLNVWVLQKVHDVDQSHSESSVVDGGNTTRADRRHHTSYFTALQNIFSITWKHFLFNRLLLLQIYFIWSEYFHMWPGYFHEWWWCVWWYCTCHC